MHLVIDWWSGRTSYLSLSSLGFINIVWCPQDIFHWSETFGWSNHLTGVNSSTTLCIPDVWRRDWNPRSHCFVIDPSVSEMHEPNSQSCFDGQASRLSKSIGGSGLCASFATSGQIATLKFYLPHKYPRRFSNDSGHSQTSGITGQCITITDPMYGSSPKKTRSNRWLTIGLWFSILGLLKIDPRRFLADLWKVWIGFWLMHLIGFD